MKVVFGMESVHPTQWISAQCGEFSAHPLPPLSHWLDQNWLQMLVVHEYIDSSTFKKRVKQLTSK